MKKFYTSVLLIFCLSSFGQNIIITHASASAVSGGINVNLKVFRDHAIIYLSYSYVLSGNIINLSVCYHNTPLTMQSNFDQNFLIPVPNNLNYIVNISIVNSMSSQVCDNFSIGQTTTLNFLNSESFEFQKQHYQLVPNPSIGVVFFKDKNLQFKEVSIFDLMGRTIKIFNSHFDQFDLSDLNSGTYIAKIETEYGLISQKIILNK